MKIKIHYNKYVENTMPADMLQNVWDIIPALSIICKQDFKKDM